MKSLWWSVCLPPDDVPGRVLCAECVCSDSSVIHTHVSHQVWAVIKPHPHAGAHRGQSVVFTGRGTERTHHLTLTGWRSTQERPQTWTLASGVNQITFLFINHAVLVCDVTVITCYNKLHWTMSWSNEHNNYNLKPNPRHHHIWELEKNLNIYWSITWKCELHANANI